ncbi:Copper Transporter integral membrane protein that functions in high affinity copper transport [Trapelia coarctata]|nr:Copper Transporter integral membrane protein that functions in high affinity copper transport [Trapelia coarctata]
MAMTMGMPTATGASVAAATATAMSMGMDMGGGACKISMLWNWYTIDACFIAQSWHITSSGMFAGSCIGVILLVMSLEFLRRIAKEYDRHLLRQAERQQPAPLQRSESPQSSSQPKNDVLQSSSVLPVRPRSNSRQFRPTLLQQMIRAALHMVQFGVAYFVMLLAMYYNGYLIICILIGAFLGAFVFSWETLNLSDSKEEATFCCG